MRLAILACRTLAVSRRLVEIDLRPADAADFPRLAPANMSSLTHLPYSSRSRQSATKRKVRKQAKGMGILKWPVARHRDRNAPSLRKRA